jgi:hypothetical protein
MSRNPQIVERARADAEAIVVQDAPRAHVSNRIPS